MRSGILFRASACDDQYVAIGDPARLDGLELGIHKVPRANVIWLSGVSIVLVLLVFGAAWSLSGFHGNLWATIVAALAGIAAVVVIFAAARKWAWWGERLRPWLVGLTAFGCCMVVIGAWTGVITGLKLGGDERAWLAVAAPLLNGSDQVPKCADTQLPGIGHIQGCLGGFGGIVVLVQSTEPGRSGLIYAPNDAKINGLDTCIDHLNGPWFHFSPGSADGSCPIGTVYVPGP